MGRRSDNERRQVVIYLTFREIGDRIDDDTATTDEIAAYNAYGKSAAFLLMALIERKLGREWIMEQLDDCFPHERHVPLSDLHNPNHEEML